MQIVIDIPEEDYERLKVYKKAPFCSFPSRVYEAIANGTPLPEHHGDLKDVSKLDVISWQCRSDEFIEGVRWAMEQLDSLPSAIPATKEGDGKC